MKYKLLLAEDDFANAEFVKIVFRKANVNVFHALNGAEALDIFRSRDDIDLVLMDIKMPVMDGYCATKEIRKLNGNIPVIALTAFALEGDRERALEAGCTEYVTKPVNRDRLLGIVSSYLGKVS
jgi:CheY-like chemotaxis protein